MKLYTEMRFILTAAELYWLVREKLPELEEIQVREHEEDGYIAGGDMKGDPYLVCLDGSGNVLGEDPDVYYDILDWVAEYVRERLYEINVDDVRFGLDWDLLEDYLNKKIPVDDDVYVIDGTLVLS